MSGRLKGRIALVTGAGVGIGRATAVRLAGDGATVIATSRTLQHAEATCAAIAAAGPAPAEAITLDVADSRQVEEVVRDVADRHGRIDVLVANAGVELPHAPTVEATRRGQHGHRRTSSAWRTTGSRSRKATVRC